FFVVTGHDFSTGWTATIDGRSLGTPLVVDGYSAGWRVDRTGSYRISIRYAPQAKYTALLGISAAALVGTAAVLLVPLIRRRRRWRRTRSGKQRAPAARAGSDE
ncbi:MAG TPA: hypothetical protein DIU14_05155, partial [Actinobacteria bacterium]|nr:hypothetical protein [Actinomycetota bacterium]